MKMQKLSNCLWFDKEAEEAASFYAKVFKGTVTDVSRVPEDVKMPEGVPDLKKGTVLTATINILGQEIMLLNGGPVFSFTEAISLVVSTDDQAETDYYWNTLTADGGEESQCGWLKDKYGLSWQITPKRLIELTTSSDRPAAARATQAMLKMRNINIAELEKAYAGE
jgi:predicted 3-demethylubiquinone-9 3-methyltransferase (glyoxalase superfamily)